MSSPVPQIRSRVPRIAEEAFERARLTVVPRRRTRAARMPFVALVSMVLVGGVVGLLLFNTSMQQASFAATALEGQSTTLAARQQMLEMELDRLRDPQRIAGAAQRLGMVQACAPAFIKLGSGEVVGEPCPAVASPFPIWPAEPKLPPELNPAPNVVEVTADPVVTRDDSADTAAGDAANGARDGRKNQQHQQSQQNHQR
ncbi:hypothetical protein [Nocardioides caricicola]|uniref:Cell division protein FtsL n=1 Tax=Nocardioides caricicola TaxID=634770 RepID=A0ABW0MXL0_9ACTN